MDLYWCISYHFWCVETSYITALTLLSGQTISFGILVCVSGIIKYIQQTQTSVSFVLEKWKLCISITFLYDMHTY